LINPIIDYQGKIKEMDTSGDTAVGKPCARHGGIWRTGVKNPSILNVYTEWDEWLPSRPGCLNLGERVPGTQPTASWLSPTTDLTFLRKKKFSPMSGIELVTVRPIDSSL